MIRRQIEEGFEVIAAVDPEIRSIVGPQLATPCCPSFRRKIERPLRPGQTKFPGLQGAAQRGYLRLCQSQSFFAKYR